ncbi:MAG: hypothetical protein JWN32_1923 [Solirubrobacterales bacterium]|nr:hypothetical protein [Solirubrobacterales bacterium]
MPYEFTVLLVDERGHAVDRRGWSSGSVHVADDEQTLPARIERWRHGGESSGIEFKQALDLARTKERFAESVAAFANTAGDVALIGINDHGAIVGYGGATHDQITQIMRDLITGPPETEIARADLDGRPVWVVQVQASKPSTRPHVVRGRVLVRAHGTNRESMPREMREMTATDNLEDTFWPLR